MASGLRKCLERRAFEAARTRRKVQRYMVHAGGSPGWRENRRTAGVQVQTDLGCPKKTSRLVSVHPGVLVEGFEQVSDVVSFVGF